MVLQKQQNNTRYKNLYQYFINFFIKKGKKTKIKLKLDSIFLSISKSLSISVSLLLLKIYKTLVSFVELKKVKLKGRLHLVPFLLKSNRRKFSVLNYIKKAVLEDTRKLSFSEKLKTEILKLLLNPKTSRSLKLKKINVSKSFQNKSNAHFRW